MADPRTRPFAIVPLTDYTMGPYNYSVMTPEEDVLYFETKEKARVFIEFYKDYANKHPDRVKGKVNGPNTRTKDE